MRTIGRRPSAASTSRIGNPALMHCLSAIRRFAAPPFCGAGLRSARSNSIDRWSGSPHQSAADGSADHDCSPPETGARQARLARSRQLAGKKAPGGFSSALQRPSFWLGFKHREKKIFCSTRRAGKNRALPSGKQYRWAKAARLMIASAAQGRRFRLPFFEQFGPRPLAATDFTH